MRNRSPGQVFSNNMGFNDLRVVGKSNYIVISTNKATSGQAMFWRYIFAKEVSVVSSK